MKTTIYIFLFTLLPLLTFSQDIHFSMFYKSPVLLNPANTGNFDGKYRAVLNYRKQGDKILNPYATNLLSFDAPIFYFNRVGSIGFTAYNDRTANKTLNTNELLISTAHFLKISSNSYAHMGFGFALVNKYIPKNSFTYPNQFDNSIGLFNSNLDNGEVFNSYNQWLLDLSFGVMWTRMTPKLKTQIGIAVFHYNQPSLNFISTEYQIKPKLQIHSYFEKSLPNDLYIKPKILFTSQSKASELLVGSEFGKYYDTEFVKNIYLGSFVRSGVYRNTDALILNTGFYYKHFKFNFSFDYSVNLFNNDNYKNSTYELSIIYVFPRLQVDKRAIQCEIF